MGLEYKPIGEVLPGISVKEVDEAETFIPLEALVLIKFIDSDGDAVWMTRSTSGLTDAETIGILHAQLALLTRDFVERFRSDDPDDAD